MAQQHNSNLRDSQWYDYIWMYLLAFAAGAAIFWFGVLFIFQRGGYRESVRESRNGSRTEAKAPTAEDARKMMIKLTIIGGVLGVGSMIIWQLRSKNEDDTPEPKLRKGDTVWRRDDS
jgi:hypothetical protein